jgi:hypothetical protein
MPTRSPCGSGGAQPSRCQSAAARSSARASGCSSTRTTLPELPEELRPRDPPLDRLDPAFCYVARTTLQLRRPRGLKVPVVRVLQAGEHLLHEPSPLGAGEPQDLREQFFRRHGRHVVRSGRRCTTLSRGSRGSWLSVAGMLLARAGRPGIFGGGSTRVRFFRRTRRLYRLVGRTFLRFIGDGTWGRRKALGPSSRSGYTTLET